MNNVNSRVVYITGITGKIGRVLVEGLKNDYALRGSSRRGGEIDGAVVTAGDVTDPHFLKEEFEGIDTVIHLAGNARADAEWDELKNPNIEGVYQLYEAALHCGVRRVIFASTNHVTGILTEQVREMDGDEPVRPDGLYGVSKVFGEALGRYYSDRYGLSVLNFRIGWMQGEMPDDQVVDLFKDIQNAYPLMWLSAGDCVRAHRAGIEADPNLQYGTYYIMSNNRDMLWDMQNARDELGYAPLDDLGVLFDERGLHYDFRKPSSTLGG